MPSILHRLGFLDSLAQILAVWVSSCSILIFSRLFHWHCQWPLIQGPLSSTATLMGSEGQSQPTVAGKPLNLISVIPSLLPPSPGAWSTDWIYALISLQASSCSRAEVIFSCPNCQNESVHPNPGLSICYEWSQQPPGRLCKHMLLGGQVLCPGLYVWAYPAMDQAQGCLTLILCKDQSLNCFMSPSPCHHQPGLPINLCKPLSGSLRLFHLWNFAPSPHQLNYPLLCQDVANKLSFLFAMLTQIFKNLSFHLPCLLLCMGVATPWSCQGSFLPLMILS